MSIIIIIVLLGFVVYKLYNSKDTRNKFFTGARKGLDEAERFLNHANDNDKPKGE